jgi:hypothetical protein
MGGLHSESPPKNMAFPSFIYITGHASPHPDKSHFAAETITQMYHDMYSEAHENWISNIQNN